MNCVHIIGSLAADPALGNDHIGQTVCKLRLAVPTGKPPRNVRVDVKVLGSEAGNCAANLTRGRWVAVSGSLGFVEWVGKDGVIRSRLYVQTWHVGFLGSPREATADDKRDEWQSIESDEEDLEAKVASYPVQTVRLDAPLSAAASEPEASEPESRAAPEPGDPPIEAQNDADDDEASAADDLVKPDWQAEDYEIDESDSDSEGSREEEVDRVAGD